jgi:hypothetical protein
MQTPGLQLNSGWLSAQPNRVLASLLSVFLTLCVFQSITVEGVIFYSTGDPDFNTSAPTGDLANSGWELQGLWGIFLGTPIAPKYFITVEHVGGSPGNKFVLGGKEYTTAASFDDPESDLRIWRIRETFPTYAELYPRDDELGRNFVVFGRGTQRGDEVIIDGLFGSHFRGWYWGSLDGRQRWGENRVAEIISDAGLDGAGKRIGGLLRVRFNAGQGVNHAHLSNGDSTGGVFIKDGNTWKLAGINYAVDGPYNTTTNGPGFTAALVDERGLYKGGEGHWRRQLDSIVSIPGSFYVARISARLDWINTILSQPLTPDPPLLQSAASVNGPYQNEGSGIVDEQTRTITITRPSGFRFYRISAPAQVRVKETTIENGNLIFRYE